MWPSTGRLILDYVGESSPELGPTLALIDFSEIIKESNNEREEKRKLFGLIG